MSLYGREGVLSDPFGGEETTNIVAETTGVRRVHKDEMNENIARFRHDIRQLTRAPEPLQNGRRLRSRYSTGHSSRMHD
jgi:hypothetical protein